MNASVVMDDGTIRVEVESRQGDAVWKCFGNVDTNPLRHDLDDPDDECGRVDLCVVHQTLDTQTRITAYSATIDGAVAKMREAFYNMKSLPPDIAWLGMLARLRRAEERGRPMTRTPDTIIAAVRALYGETHHPASAANAFTVDALRGRYEREATRPTPVHGGTILGLLRTCAVLIAERDAATSTPTRSGTISTNHVVKGAGACGQPIPTRVTPWTEGTADPIYVLQRREFICTNLDRYHYDDTLEELCDERGTIVDLAYMQGDSDWVEDWKVDRVFFTRAECEAYGQAHAYNYKDGWRSYSLHTVGELRTLLRMVTTREERPTASEGGEHG